MIQSLPLWAVDKVYFMLENFLLDVVNFWIIIAKCSTYWFSSHFVSCQWTYWVSTCYRKATDAEDCRVNPQAPWKDQEAGARQHFNCSRTFKIRKGRKKEKVMMQATRRCIFSRRLSRPVRAFSLHSNLGHDKQIPSKLWLLYIFILSHCYFHIGVLSFIIRVSVSPFFCKISLALFETWIGKLELLPPPFLLLQLTTWEWKDLAQITRHSVAAFHKDAYVSNIQSIKTNAFFLTSKNEGHACVKHFLFCTCVNLLNIHPSSCTGSRPSMTYSAWAGTWETLSSCSESLCVRHASFLEVNFGTPDEPAISPIEREWLSILSFSVLKRGSFATKRPQKKEPNHPTCFDDLGMVGLFAADLVLASGLEAPSGEVDLFSRLKRWKYESYASHLNENNISQFQLESTLGRDLLCLRWRWSRTSAATRWRGVFSCRRRSGSWRNIPTCSTEYSSLNFTNLDSDSTNTSSILKWGMTLPDRRCATPDCWTSLRNDQNVLMFSQPYIFIHMISKLELYQSDAAVICNCPRVDEILHP